MKAIYKCRLCGETFHNETIDGADEAREIATDIVNSNVSRGLWLTAFHCCGDGSLGVSDFQGFKTLKH